MRLWIGLGAGALIAAGFVDPSPFGIEAEAPGGLRQLAGSEVYIEQPLRRALEKTEPGVGGKDGEGELKPAQGPPSPSSRQPESCDPQNAPSQACYTATQQARPIPR